MTIGSGVGERARPAAMRRRRSGVEARHHQTSQRAGEEEEDDGCGDPRSAHAVIILGDGGWLHAFWRHTVMWRSFIWTSEDQWLANARTQVDK